MKNVFENAYFGKEYRTRDGRKAIYHYSKEYKSGDGKIWTYHYLMVEPTIINFFGKPVVVNHYDAYINDDGIGRFANLKYYKDSGANADYDIVSEWEPIDEEKLNRLAIKAEKETFKNSDLPFQTQWVAGFEAGFEAGSKQVYIKKDEE